MKKFELPEVVRKSSRVIAASIILGAGAAACSNRESTPHTVTNSTHEGALAPSSLTLEILNIDPNGSEWGQGSSNGVSQEGLTRTSRLPNGLQISATIKKTETLKQADAMKSGSTGQPNISPQNVDEIDVQVFTPASIVGEDKPLYGYSFVKDSNSHQWDATYYQEFDPSLPYATTTYSDGKISYYSSPGAQPVSYINPNQARFDYKKFSMKSHDLIIDLTNNNSANLLLPLHGESIFRV